MTRNAFALLLMLVAMDSTALTFPAKPLRIIVPFPAGGIVDLIARTLNE
jgi:tripartite-type tricarboxylate transporter receptor subunit TctC